MDRFEVLVTKLINKTYFQQGQNAITSRNNLLKILMAERKLPLNGWDEISIEYTINQFTMMDSNNFMANIGAGEREGRIFSSIVAKRHFYLSHGIGRSGDISEIQPKAAGSSIISKLTSSMALHALHLAGMKSMQSCLVLPTATGLSLTLCILSLKSSNPDAKYVIWSRIDQKSCFKSIITAGMTPLVVDTILIEDEACTDTVEIERLLQIHGSNILCVLTTTSCFAPRRPDMIDIVATLCSRYHIAHLINNAYGIQCKYISKLIQRAVAIGRVDYVVQSTDKNFLVPVGGAIVASPSKSLINALSQSYPGRASMTPILDLFITFLQLGEKGLLKLWHQRNELFPQLITGLQTVAEKYGQRLLISPHNSISFAVTLTIPPLNYTKIGLPDASENISPLNLQAKDSAMTTDPITNASPAVRSGIEVSDLIEDSWSTERICTLDNEDKEEVSNDRSVSNINNNNNINLTYFGSLLFHRLVSGARVIPSGHASSTSHISNISFHNWGSHMPAYPVPYFTIACAVGQQVEEVAELLVKLDRVFWEFYRHIGYTRCSDDVTTNIEITNERNPMDVVGNNGINPLNNNSRIYTPIANTIWIDVYNPKVRGSGERSCKK